MAQLPPRPPRPGAPGPPPRPQPPRPQSAGSGRGPRRDREPLDLQTVLLALRRRWWRMSRRRQLIFAVSTLMGLTVLVGLVCGSGGPPPELIKRAGSKAVAGELQAARDRAAAAAVVQVRDPRLKLTLTFQRSPRLLLLQSSGGTVAVDGDGDRWLRAGRCWKPYQQAPKPNVDAVLLPWSDPTVRFGTPQTTAAGERIIPFQARTFGSWGPGDGVLQLQGGRPSRYSYQPDDGSLSANLQVSYPDRAPVQQLQPQC